MHHSGPATPAAAPDDQNRFRRGATWLRKSGIGHTGKKAKRLIHRRDRHQTRHQLQNLA